MHSKVKKQKLYDALSKIQGVTDKNSVMPALNHFLLDVSETNATVFATDLETAIKLPVEAEIIGAGKICIPAKKFYEIIKGLDEDIELSLEKEYLKIKSGRTTFKIAVLNASEFPEWPEIGEATQIVLHKNIFTNAINKTIYAVGEPDLRFTLNSLLFEIKNGEFHSVGTDGHRLAHFKTNINTSEDKKILLSEKSLISLRKLLIDIDTETVSFYIGKGHVLFEIGEIKFLSRIVEGNFPDYDAILAIIKNNNKEAVVDRNSFINSLKRISILSKNRQNIVKIDWDKDKVVISTSDPEFGEAQDEFDTTYNGELFIIGFNAKYLIDALSEIESDKAKITMSEPDKAVYVINNEPNGNYIYESIVMPMRL